MTKRVETFNLHESSRWDDGQLKIIADKTFCQTFHFLRGPGPRKIILKIEH